MNAHTLKLAAITLPHDDRSKKVPMTPSSDTRNRASDELDVLEPKLQAQVDDLLAVIEDAEQEIKAVVEDAENYGIELQT